ncbi:hypothetical protein [Aureimonas sp. AU40]|uniref:hypothetical protein n=1 Tax=Aureimonas sp. AU40 TaxID=1637747 RepID=UPI000AE7E745|nr:hypothetical protein [Aureimonas sp. AU40]
MKLGLPGCNPGAPLLRHSAGHVPFIAAPGPENGGDLYWKPSRIYFSLPKKGEADLLGEDAIGATDDA